MKQSHTTQLTQKQKQILNLLYRFRFLNRHHIQSILKHKHHSRILNWLNKLTQQKYILRSFDKSFVSDPALYHLSKDGRKYLKNIPELKINSLDRVWRESSYSEVFKKHCLFLADIYILLLIFTKESKTELHFHTKTDLYGMEHLINPNPDAYFDIRESKDNTKRYFLDILDDLPPSMLRKRTRQYFEYFSSDEWQDSTGKDFPEILLICPNKRIKNHLYYYIRDKLKNEPDIKFYLAVKDLVETKGLTPEALEAVKPEE